MTNKEKINKMSSRELAEILEESCCKFCIYSGLPCKDLSCTNGIALFLDDEVKENEVKQSD